MTIPSTYDAGISFEATPEGSLITLWGEIDAALRDRASDAMAQVLTHPGPVTIDVGRVTFIDSSGIAFILQVYMLGTEDGRAVVLQDPTSSLEDLLEMIGMSGTIPVVRTAAAGS
ncbi:STAS domain-containing protein [Oerskovia sp. Sa1BUA8]|uniref:STAS domain-containing protein n=1 Tax=Oerskovia douganii TaxID=2762210 RepID=A0A9D5U8L8_9CELL|nr:STAS domain-containing protein [Oerskovia douganii]MBE7700549.1 STAS domain-containing protein [Oerskovia douganii]